VIELPINLMIRWPVVRLALRRILRVKGRIIFLISSINTSKGIRRKGVDIGTKWAKDFCVWNNHAKVWGPAQMHKERERLIHT